MSRPVIMWTWQDGHIEDHGRVEAELVDIARHGFAGALIQLRGCRYPVTDPLVRAAVGRAVAQARPLGLAVWLCLDPRLGASAIKRETGEAAAYWIVAHGDNESAMARRQQRLPLDVEAPIGEDGRFEIRLRYPRTRPHHMHSDGALYFLPLRLDRVFAFRKTDPDTVVRASVQDITPCARMWINHLAGQVEVFGRWQPPEAGDWYALAFVLFDSNYPEFAGPATRKVLARELERYREMGIILDGIFWDEPGYATGFDPAFRADRMRLPGGERIAEIFKAKTGLDLADHLYLLVRDDDSGAFAGVRQGYYEAVQEAVLGCQRELGKAARRLFGPHTEIGIHATWHQNADDLIHGSGDWWESTRVLTGGFTDVGSAEELDRPEQVREIVSMLVLAGSLARRSATRQAWINLWGVRYGEPGGRYPQGVVDYWLALMAVFGVRWVAHTYGPTSYFGRPAVWGPGYPHHPTWARFPEWNALCEQVGRLTGCRPPVADILLVWPLESLVRAAGPAANPIADAAKEAILQATDAGLWVDVVSPRLLAEARVEGGQLALGAERYRGVVCLEPPESKTAQTAGLRSFAEQGGPVVFWDLQENSPADLPAVLGEAGLGPAVELPKGAYAGLWARPGGWTVALCSRRFGERMEGSLAWGPLTLEVSGWSGLVVAQYDAGGRLVERLDWEIRDVEDAEERTRSAD